jgi:hypothetical protein
VGCSARLYRTRFTTRRFASTERPTQLLPLRLATECPAASRGHIGCLGRVGRVTCAASKSRRVFGPAKAGSRGYRRDCGCESGPAGRQAQPPLPGGASSWTSCNTHGAKYSSLLAESSVIHPRPGQNARYNEPYWINPNVVEHWSCPLTPFETRLKLPVRVGRSCSILRNPRKAINHKGLQPWQQQHDLVGRAHPEALTGGADHDGLLRFVEVGKVGGEGGHRARHSYAGAGWPVLGYRQ